MKIFVIEPDINGILSAIYLCFTENAFPDAVESKNAYLPRLGAEITDIKTDVKNAEKVKTALFTYGGDDIIALMKICLRSCAKNRLFVAFRFAVLTLKERRNVSDDMKEKIVSDFSFTVQKVLHEKHIVSGFLRFKESARGVLYAEYAPDNDITELLAPHFLRRLDNRPFVINDLKRGVICISDGKRLKTFYCVLPSDFAPSEKEKAINDLWKRYYKEINIKERKNAKQQDGFMPRRYRKYAFETLE